MPHPILSKTIIRDHKLIKGTLFILMILLLFCMGEVLSFAQVFPAYLSSTQPYFSIFNNPYFGIFSRTNSYSGTTPSIGLNSFTGINPYNSLSNSFPIFNNYTFLPQSISFPQANIAGGLIPFTSYYSNPLALFYGNNGISQSSTGLSPYFLNPLYIPSAALYFAATTTPADVSGTWSGVWISTFLAGGITTGDLSMTLAQAGSDVTGTLAFFLNKILKFGTDIVGTVTGNSLILTSTVIPSAGGTKTFDVTVSATVNGDSMDGTYEVINNVTGNIAEEGTFTATRL